MPISPARTVAQRVLLRVEQGAWASELLQADTAALSSPDAGLAHTLVFGVLRRRAQLDYLLERTARRPVAKLDPAVRAALRLGAFQAVFLSRIPRHALVNDSVELVKQAGKRSAGGLVNAVLRRLEPTDEWPTDEIRFSCPAWLLHHWTARFGRSTALRIAAAFLDEPVPFVRIPPGHSVPENAAPTDVPGAYQVLAGTVPGVRRQDISSQSVVPLLDLQPGCRFLDLCAAPGNKTAQALETPVQAVACELHAHRARELAVLGIPVIRLDGTQPLPFRQRFDRILLDAPCSGTGTLGRNPEIKWRVSLDNLSELSGVQRDLLRQALGHLAPGGRLVYSTCSLEREENEDVVAAVLPDFPADVRQTMQRIPGRDAGDGFYAAVITLR